MTQLRAIDIDWEIHQLIERERSSFAEPPYIALRRLLKLPAPKEVAPATATATATATSFDAGNAWTDSGVTVPHGSRAKMEYLRGTQIYEGQFLNGKLVVGGQSFDTLSSAADALAKTSKGQKVSLNGWLYWKVQFPGETTWRSLNDMRRA